MYSYWGGKVIKLFLIKNKCHKQKPRLSGRQSSTGLFQEKLMRRNINIGSPITCSWCEERSEGNATEPARGYKKLELLGERALTARWNR